MKTYNQLVTDYKTISRDSSSGNETLGKQMINDFIHEILSLSDWTWNRGTSTDVTVADQQYYPLPYNLQKLRNVKITVSSTDYIPKEVVREEDWNLLNSTTSSSTVPTYFFIKSATKKIGFYPIPSANSNTITYSFQKKVIDYSQTDYTTGTLSATNGSTTVTGSGTTWTASMVGRYIQISDFWYEISAFVSTTELTLLTEFGGTTATGLTYTISEISPILEGFENLPMYKALWIYFQSIENPVQANQYRQLYEDGIKNLIKRDKKTTGSVFKQNIIVQQDPNNYPTIS